jgi:hypothetical protein
VAYCVELWGDWGSGVETLSNCMWVKGGVKVGSVRVATRGKESQK